MAHPFLHKLKETIIEGATFSAAKAEVAAKKGKLHLDLIAERRKLGARFEQLGKLIYQNSSEESQPEFLKSDEYIELLGEIKITEDLIEDLSRQITEVTGDEE